MVVRQTLRIDDAESIGGRKPYPPVVGHHGRRGYRLTAQKGSDAIGAVVQRRVQCAAGIAELTFPDASDAAVRGQPQRPAAIVDNPQDGVARQAVLTVPCHDAAASKAAESAFGADPERSVRIEEQRPHFALTDSAAGGMAGSDAPVG